MEKKEFSYEIGGKKYIQKKLVLGQIEQLVELLPGIRFTSMDPLAIIGALGTKLANALAIVLIPEGVQLKDKDISALAEEIRFTIEPEQTMEVVRDFFICTPVVSLLEQFNLMVTTIETTLKRGNGSESSSVSLPEETSSSATTSAGGSP